MDAVSIATFDIDYNGKLLLWSPFANIENIENLEASMKLPIPTGKRFKFEESSNSYLPTKDFLIKYRSILNINRVMEGSGTNTIPSATELEVSFKKHMDASDILLLGNFLREIEFIKIPAKRYYEKFIEELNNDGWVDDIFTSAYIPSLFNNL